MNVVIRNLPDNTSEEEIGELLKEHGVPVTDVSLTNEGDEERYVAVVALDTDHAGANSPGENAGRQVLEGQDAESARPDPVHRTRSQ